MPIDMNSLFSAMSNRPGMRQPQTPGGGGGGGGSMPPNWRSSPSYPVQGGAATNSSPAIAASLGVRPNLNQGQQWPQQQSPANPALQTPQSAPMDPLLWAQQNAPDLFAEYQRLQNNRDPREWGKDKALLAQIKQMADAAAQQENQQRELARQQEELAYQTGQKRNQEAYSLQQQRDEENRRKALILGGRGTMGSGGLSTPGKYGSSPEPVPTGVFNNNTQYFGQRR